MVSKLKLFFLTLHVKLDSMIKVNILRYSSAWHCRIVCVNYINDD